VRDGSGALLLRLISHLPFGLKRNDIRDLLGTADADEEAQDLIDVALVTVSAGGSPTYVGMLVVRLI
jgi:hypothetical protein